MLLMTAKVLVCPQMKYTELVKKMNHMRLKPLWQTVSMSFSIIYQILLQKKSPVDFDVNTSFWCILKAEYLGFVCGTCLQMSQLAKSVRSLLGFSKLSWQILNFFADIVKISSLKLWQRVSSFNMHNCLISRCAAFLHTLKAPAKLGRKAIQENFCGFLSI